MMKIKILFVTLLLSAIVACTPNTKEELSKQPIHLNSGHNCSIDNSTNATGKSTGTGYKILILMYHNLSSGFPSNEYDRKKSDFENDLKYILSKNYQLISMDDLLKLKSGQMQLNRDAIILTFDDGYASWYTKATPLLKKYNMPATYFIVPEWIGSSNYMTWANVYELHNYTSNGNHLFSIHSHTSSHPLLKQWGNAKPPAVWQNFLNLQLGESIDWIKDVTQQPTMFLALPYGDGAGDSTITQTAISKGYNGIRTSERASFTVDEMDLFRLPSVVILSTTRIETIDNYFN
jgi:peptidoglycan/xylan/chitin deacetylase (PgdA/CDA1 family)